MTSVIQNICNLLSSADFFARYFFYICPKKPAKPTRKLVTENILKCLLSFSSLFEYFSETKNMNFKNSYFIDRYKFLNWIYTQEESAKDHIYTFLFSFSVKWLKRLSCAKIVSLFRPILNPVRPWRWITDWSVGRK